VVDNRLVSQAGRMDQSTPQDNLGREGEE